MRKYIPTSHTHPCPVCGDQNRRCRHLPNSPNTMLCMSATDAFSAPSGWQFLKLTRDGLWGIVQRSPENIDDASSSKWANHWRNLHNQRLHQENARHPVSRTATFSKGLSEEDRDIQIRHVLRQLPLSIKHQEDLKRRRLNDELIVAGKFKSVEQWHKLKSEVSYRLAGVSLGGRSLITPQSGYLCPVWNPEGQIIGWQLRVDNPGDDAPKYLWASSRTKNRPNGPTVHLHNGELPLTFCTPVVQGNWSGDCMSFLQKEAGEQGAGSRGDNWMRIEPHPIEDHQNQRFGGGLDLEKDKAEQGHQSSVYAFCSLPPAPCLAQNSSLVGPFIGLAEGILKPWIIAQLRHQITIGAAGGNFAGSPQTFKRYLTAATASLDGTKDVLLWADAGAIANKNVMRQYRRTYELLTHWGYNLRVAWWGQLDKSCLDGDEYTGEFEVLTWAQFESLSRNPLSFWDNVTQELNRIKRLLSPKRGFLQKPHRVVQPSQARETLTYICGNLPTPEQYKKLGCPKIIYSSDERVSLWQEAVSKGWQHILDKSAPGLGKSHTAGSMKAEEFSSRQLWYLASDHRNPTTLTVETNFVDLPPRNNGFVYDTTRLTPSGQPFLVHPNGLEHCATTAGNCHRTSMFRTLTLKNIDEIGESDNPICISCHLYNACRHTAGSGFGYRFQRHSVLQYPQIRAHPDSLPNPVGYQFSDCGIFWDEASQIMRSRFKIEVHLSDFNQTLGELSLSAPSLYEKLKPTFELLRFLCWGNHDESAIFKRDIPPPQATRYGYNDATIRQLLGTPPDNLAELINQLIVELSLDLDFLAQTADSIDVGVSTKAKYISTKQINRLFRSTANQEAKRALEAVTLNWLVPLLKVWGGYHQGVFQFSMGVLTIHLLDTRHRDVANAAQYNIYLDSTLNVNYLALKLNVNVEDVLVVEQKTPQYNNLKVVNITSMGVLGRDRRSSMHQRLESLRTEIEKLSPQVTFIERKSYAKPGDGYHFRDSRGVNRFQEATAIASIGIPYPNIGSLAAEYQVLTGKPAFFDLPQVFDEDESIFTQVSTAAHEDFSFKEFVDSCVQSEIIQESGRLRAHLRPNEKLVYYFVGDYDLDFLSKALPGITLEKIAATEISPSAGTTKQQAIWVISRLFSRIFSQDSKPTQQAISQLAKAENQEITQGRISQICKDFGGWSIFKKLITELLSNFIKTHSQNNYKFDKEERWIKDVYLPLLFHIGEIQPIETIQEVYQLISISGLQTFCQFIKSVAIDIKTTLLEYLFLFLPQDIFSIIKNITHNFNEDSS